MLRNIARAFTRSQNKYASLNVGDSVQGFTINSMQEFPDFNIKLIHLKHPTLQTQYYHFDAVDTNNVGAFLFRTPPPNSTGMCHILEHLSLCGSQQYPVRDPFFKMIKRSLNTFMNAWTGNDFTMYPFSTKNQKDFANLLSVYTDAVFFPLLNYYDFRQEGHRLEFDDKNPSKLEEKGVVLNEMKGSMSEPDNYFLQSIYSNLFSKSCYKYNSGGDPHKIVELSYEKLVEFHNTYYHPSNCTILTYGDMDFRTHLEYINKAALSKFSHKNIDSAIQIEDKWLAPKKIIENCIENSYQTPVEQSKYSISFLCNKFGEPLEDTRKLQFLSYLLFQGTDSICYKNLIETGLGKGFCPGYGFDTSTQQSTFTIGVQGTNLNEQSESKLHKAIIDVLKYAKENGFKKSDINKVAHNILLNIVI